MYKMAAVSGWARAAVVCGARRLRLGALGATEEFLDLFQYIGGCIDPRAANESEAGEGSASGRSPVVRTPPRGGASLAVPG